MSGKSVSAGPRRSTGHLQPRILLACAAVAAGAGLWGGFGRLGWSLPVGDLAGLHGPLLICGLFGIVIGVERAVAFGRPYGFLAPVLSATGTLLLLGGTAATYAAAFYTGSAATLTVVTTAIAAAQPALFTATLVIAALAWLVGNAMWWLGSSVPDVSGWWLAFLVLTIGAERLELSRVLPPRRGAAALFVAAAILLVAGAAVGINDETGRVVFGAALLALSAWLARHDIATRNIRRTGQARFMAACMLAGYGWLAVAGAVLMANTGATFAFGYDVTLHAVLIGFVLSMVFGHALIIVPAVARTNLSYSPLLYLPLVLLHLSVAMRVASGLVELHGGRMASGMVTGLALATFVAILSRSATKQAGPALRT